MFTMNWQVMMMNNIISYIALSENDKRIIIALVIVFVLLFVLIGLIGMLVTKIMKQQGKAIDRLMHDIVVTGVVSDKKHFKKVAKKKSWRYLYKQARIPIIIALIATMFLLIYYLTTGNWNANIFGDWGAPNGEGGKGFATLLFLLDFENCPTTEIFGITVISDWPALLNSPHFSVDAWGSYIFVPLIITSIIWFFVVVQAFIARTFRIRKLASQIYDKSLDDYNQTKALLGENSNNINNQ